MEFINRILSSLFFVNGAGASKLRLIAVCALLAASAAGPAQFNQPQQRRAQAEQATALQAEAPVRRLKIDGGYTSLAAALAAARYQINATRGQSGAPFYANNTGQRLLFAGVFKMPLSAPQPCASTGRTHQKGDGYDHPSPFIYVIWSGTHKG